MAQWKRAGPITQRSVDRNYLLLIFFQDGTVEACWAHNPEVGRSKLPPANFFPRISERKEIETVTSQINKRESGNIYTTLPQKNHNTGPTVFIKP